MESVSLERITVAVYGLTQGGGGTLAAEQALSRVPGVSRAYVNAATEMAYVEYDPAQTTHAQLLRAIEGAGLRAGEVNMRSVGSLSPLAAVRRAAPAGSERDTPAILTDPPPAGTLAVTRRVAVAVAPDAPLSGTRDRDRMPAQAHKSHLAGHLSEHLAGRLSGPWVGRLPVFASAMGLAVILGALLWLAAAGQHMPENTFTVEVGASDFRPVAVVIPAGKPATLRVHNADLDPAHTSGASHQFAISELGINIKLQPGQTVVINLPPLQPATYHYYCDICCENSNDPSMQGVLIVH